MTQLSAKPTLRAQLLAARLAIGESERATANEAISKHLAGVIPADAAVVAFYRAIKGEADIQQALIVCFQRGQTVCLPDVRDNGLQFRHWSPEQPLQKDRYGIETPHENAPVLQPDWVIVPLLGYDENGNRLGYGAGYYDAYIARIRAQKKRVRFIGAAYSVQQIASLPVDPHDQRLDAVVTEKGMIRF